MNDKSNDSGCFTAIVVGILMLAVMAHGGHLIRLDDKINEIENRIEILEED